MNYKILIMKEITIREIEPNEISLLKEILYKSIYRPDTITFIPKSILEKPEMNAYIKDFGCNKDDFCLVADLRDKIIGAVWVRTFSGNIKGYGYFDDNTPVFVIALYKEYRNQGIGTQLMANMIKHLHCNGYKQASLNVKKANYAVKLYKKMGFEIIGESEFDYLMLLKCS